MLFCSVGFVELFIGFLLFGLMLFGGVLLFVWCIIVDECKWFFVDEFIDLFGLC